MNLCLVGCGRWGKSYLNTIEKIDSINVNWIVIRKTIPKIDSNYKIVYDLDKLLKEQHVDGVIIAAPPKAHFELAKICIKYHVPLLIEKPFTTSYQESKILHEEFKKNRLICVVGYQHLLSKKYNLIKKNTKNAGKIKNIYSIAISEGPFRKDVSVVRDWGSHEVALALDLFEEIPKLIEIKKVKKNYTNIYKGLFNLQMQFSGKRYFNSFFGNQSSIKKQELIVEYDQGLIFQDKLSQYGNVTISNSKFLNLKEIIEINTLPLEASLKIFYNKVENSSYFANTRLSLMVNKVLDQIEVKLRS